MGASLNTIRDFPMDVRRDVGFQLDKVQHGLEPSNYKPMSSIGQGVREIRVRDKTGAYRVIYMARPTKAIYVLAAFKKQRQKTPKQELDKARSHYAEIVK